MPAPVVPPSPPTVPALRPLSPLPTGPLFATRSSSSAGDGGAVLTHERLSSLSPEATPAGPSTRTLRRRPLSLHRLRARRQPLGRSVGGGDEPPVPDRGAGAKRARAASSAASLMTPPTSGSSAAALGAGAAPAARRSRGRSLATHYSSGMLPFRPWASLHREGEEQARTRSTRPRRLPLGHAATSTPLAPSSAALDMSASMDHDQLSTYATAAAASVSTSDISVAMVAADRSTVAMSGTDAPALSVLSRRISVAGGECVRRPLSRRVDDDLIGGRGPPTVAPADVVGQTTVPPPPPPPPLPPLPLSSVSIGSVLPSVRSPSYDVPSATDPVQQPLRRDGAGSSRGLRRPRAGRRPASGDGRGQ
eukprot:TRINITY_DN6655_c0_g1_i2.p1 TRINITY_DN6655_c0_g1~~TRINITY_DN6655_c0_g1_i2.p1  ORF type:complete len:364 (+),score=94.02 TRINITY_DN6655_c0_g1_i2:759-1850(+)